MIKKIACAAVCLALLLNACTVPPSQSTPSVSNGSEATASSETSTAPAETQQIESHRAMLVSQTIAPLDNSFIQGINDFGFSAASSLYDTEDNVALSPVSISLALCMTRAGAASQTAQEMADTLGLAGLTDEQIEEACRQLMWRTNTGGMEAANAIWLSSNYTFSSDFIDTCTNGFMADAFPLVIPGAMDEINAWADEKTHGRINQILSDELPPETQIVLANALYYLGEWAVPFEADDTHDREFQAPDGSVTTAFMHSTRSVPYYTNDDFSMISLDFKSTEDEGQYAMAFLLPAEGKTISDMLSALNGGAFAAALEDGTEQEVKIQLPKFEFEYFVSLKDTLSALGMPQAFDPASADFSAMTEEENNIYIDAVLHKCYVRVDELGAEAAAVTAVVGLEAAVMEDPDLPVFYADRPFLFAIYSLEDGVIAFLSVVNNPA